jgi:hypothetical protein
LQHVMAGVAGVAKHRESIFICTLFCVSGPSAGRVMFNDVMYRTIWGRAVSAVHISKLSPAANL